MFWRKQRAAEPPSASVPDGRRVYAIGDIHGRADLLDELVEQMAEHAARRPAARQVIVYLGDYVDRGPDSAGVIDRLLAEPADGTETVCLLGNHEQWLLDFLASPERTSAWLRHGGAETLASYGVEPPAPDDEGRWLCAAAAALREALPVAHRAFLARLELMHREGDYLFVHAGINPSLPLARQQARDLLWIRDRFTRSDADHGVVVVHGHSAGERPVERANRICVDTGAFATGRLTCIVLEGDEREYLHT